MEIESSNLVDRLIKASDSLWMTKHSWKGGGGRGWSRDAF